MIPQFAVLLYGSGAPDRMKLRTGTSAFDFQPILQEINCFIQAFPNQFRLMRRVLTIIHL